ncbi:hypothetical protein [Salinactinospora qingdaonensis]|uniref:Carboxypeptidase regulatory-like domain-containing protein n=1 Tax=Salinactinospora qingdaonensis TaxID=702744 RepID=A0ABP7ETS0_9ACTN
MPLDDPTDDEWFVIRALGGSAPVDPMPAELPAKARVGYRARRPEADVADLVDDSATDPPRGVRELSAFGEGTRLLTFATPDVHVRLEITSRDRLCDIVGQLTPGGAGTVEVRWDDGATTATVDTAGAFVVHNIPPGPMSIVFHRTGQSPLATRWVTV